MRFSFVAYCVVICALTVPLAGCLETVGHPAYNHGPSVHMPTCRPPSQSAGEVINYGCMPEPH